MLRSLAHQDPVPGTEVIIVDDGCTDDTADVVAAAGHELVMPLRVVAGPRRGRAAARNCGATATTARRILFLDDDILAAPGLLAAHGDPAHAVPLIEPGPGGARNLLVHGPLREIPRAETVVAHAPADPYAAVAGGGFGRTVQNAIEQLVTGMASGRYPRVAPWLAGVGANMSVPAAAWRALGGFDEEFGSTWGCEDLEFGYRLVAAGYVPAIAADAQGFHLTHARPQRWAEHEINLDRFARLHPAAEVRSLDRLLSPRGSPDAYLKALDTPEACIPEGPLDTPTGGLPQ
jgi:glycosyltransferase involved in cell wall biosynthesis